MKKIFLFLFIILTMISFSKKLIIFHAGSLTNVLKAIAIEFEKNNPDVEVQLMSSGSLVVVRKITELGQMADLAFVADYTIIPSFLYPEYANFNVIFSNNSMVLGYTENSKYSEEINKDNWYKVIFNKGVIFGHSNPDLDPAGYRTLMAMQLAEKYYNLNGLYNNFLNSKNRMILKKSIDLIAYLEATEMDYAFLYKSNAIQHNLKYIEFPDEINLSSVNFEENYNKTFIEVPGKNGEKTKIYGKSINYSFTIPKNANNKNEAIEFIKFMYSDEGKRIFKEKGMELFVNVDNPNNIPNELKKIWRY
ncbi:extracellular solute-binding protein [Marinitoga litoralis]|uniref:extracellular solute-binding protein n=1 Tax=Marinitoga litoralis TaxID=570855 RepID=UPI001962263C|nr:extracellular solute-binding protein [Marinitoga litoralis]MBM7558370.1 molybdate/tungstate transport system substrate-binding protein [Marinitoga litoralis]